MQQGPVSCLDGATLVGLRVVAVEHALSAPLCTRHLADLGADVIKIERPPNGDFARRYDSVVNGESSWFAWLNRGKRTVLLDLQTDDGKNALGALIDNADVLVSNLGPEAIDHLGLDGRSLHVRWPRLISCRISGYGPSGPFRNRKAFDLLLQAEAGVIAVTGTEDHPAKVGISIADISAGMYALTGVLAAVVARERDGKGRHFEISMLDCLAEWMSVPMYYAMHGDAHKLRRAGTRHSLIVPYGAVSLSDGSTIVIAVHTDDQWHRFCEIVLSSPELGSDSRYSTNAQRLANRASLEPLVDAIFLSLTREDATARLLAADVPFSSMNSVEQVLEHPQLRDRHRWRIGLARDAAFKYVVPPFLADVPEDCVPEVPPLSASHGSQGVAWLGRDAQQSDVSTDE